jgi:hypothetical protein
MAIKVSEFIYRIYNKRTGKFLRLGSSGKSFWRRPNAVNNWLREIEARINSNSYNPYNCKNMDDIEVRVFPIKKGINFNPTDFKDFFGYSN